MNFQRGDMFYDNPHSHSENSHRLQSQGTFSSAPAPVDSPANSFSGFYQPDDQSSRYGEPRYNDRMAAATMQSNYGGYDMGHQTWNNSAFGHNTLGAIGGTNRMKPSSRGRSALPSGWLDQPPPMQSVSPFLGIGGSSAIGGPSARLDQAGSDVDEDLIPTAIVIKNIPFAVKKEQLIQIMTDLGLPLPYAFNYHFDNGIFRGLAFANFTSAEETAHVIDMLNHYELQGRKLRVEYKKMLPAAERERIEREKRERRGQLEEQHRPMPAPTLHNQPSMVSLANIPPPASPSPVSARGGSSAVDMNDPETLQFYTKLAIFKESTEEVYVYPPNLTPQQRRIVHTLAHHMGLSHMSKGVGEGRAVHVYRQPPVERLSPPVPQLGPIRDESQRRTLNRAATTDFNDVRNGGDSGLYGLRQQNSGYLPTFPSQNNNLSTSNNNLRAAKSFADLRSYTPSPVPSTASFPASLSNNVARIQEQGREGNGAPGLVAPPGGLTSRDDGLLVNGLGSLSIGNGFDGGARTLRGMVSWDRGSGANVGTIGGHRSISTNNHFDDHSRDRSQGMPSRQPRGPTGTGFSRNRQNGHMTRGSDDFSPQSAGIDASAE